MGFIRKMWKMLPPGVFIAMMGLLAALYPLLSQEPVPPISKAIWTGVFFSLMVLEIVVIFRERGKQDAAFLSQIVRLDAIGSAHAAHGLALERIKDLVEIDSVRSKALRLSESILAFVQQRLDGEPPLPRDRSIRFARDPKLGYAYAHLFPSPKLLAYQKETKELYERNFSWRAMGTVEELGKSGQEDESLRRAVSDAASDLHTIQYIGQRIGEIAEDMKN